MKRRRFPRLPNVKSKLSEKIRKIIGSLGQPKSIKWMRTGIHALDLMLGGGIPIGRIMELYGDESTGKSLLAWTIAKAWQENGGVVVVFDTEATAPKKFMQRVGVNVDEIIYRKPETIEELEKELLLLINVLTKADKDAKILFIHDSIAATSSEGEWEWDKKAKMKVPKDHEMASRARAMSKLMRHAAGKLSNLNAVYIGVNQVRDKIGVMFGEKTTTPGGRAIKFHASIRLQLNRGGRIDVEGQRPVGVICNAFVKKNKCAEPFRKAPLRILWRSGFDTYAGLAEVLEDAGRIVQVKPGVFKHKNLKFRRKNLPLIVKRRKSLLEDLL
jgi:recombination protein RecA